MATLSRKILFSLALGGLVTTSTAWSQEPEAVPPASEPIESGAIADDRVGVIQVSDCPPTDWVEPDQGSGLGCRQHVPPHAGWNQPGRRPIYRSWVPYHTFFPASWTGAEAGPQQRAPLVYMPTDTTQLGFYYQHAPTWHAYSGMIPPVPRPADWHYPYHETPYCPTGGYGQPIPMTTPTPIAPTPAMPSETGLDRSATRPQLTPITQ